MAALAAPLPARLPACLQLAEVLAEQRDLVESEQIECRSVAWFLVFAAVVVYSVAFASACVVGLGQPLPYPPSTFAAGFTLFLLLPPFNKLCVHGINAWYAHRLAAAAERRLASAAQSGAAGSRGQQPSTS